MWPGLPEDHEEADDYENELHGLQQPSHGGEEKSDY